MNKVKIVGAVTRKPFSSERFAAFSVRPDTGERKPILDVVVFDAAAIAVAGMLAEGDKVRILGHLGSKKLTDKAKAEVKVDGRDVWIIQLVADEIEAEEKPAPLSEPEF